jgi:hypothetical protein
MKVLLRVAVATLLVGLCVFPHPASAATLDANQLLELCTGQNPICTGYVMGVADAKDRDQHGISFCIPNGVSRAQLQDVVVNFLRKNPQRSFPAALLVSAAFAEAFACPG